MKLIAIRDDVYRVSNKDFEKLNRLVDENESSEEYLTYYEFTEQIRSKYKSLFTLDEIFYL